MLNKHGVKLDQKKGIHTGTKIKDTQETEQEKKTI